MSFPFVPWGKPPASRAVTQALRGKTEQVFSLGFEKLAWETDADLEAVIPATGVHCFVNIAPDPATTGTTSINGNTAQEYPNANGAVSGTNYQTLQSVTGPCFTVASNNDVFEGDIEAKIATHFPNGGVGESQEISARLAFGILFNRPMIEITNLTDGMAYWFVALDGDWADENRSYSACADGESLRIERPGDPFYQIVRYGFIADGTTQRISFAPSESGDMFPAIRGFAVVEQPNQ